MFSHIMVGADDIEASKKFYDSLFSVLGAEPGVLSLIRLAINDTCTFMKGMFF